MNRYTVNATENRDGGYWYIYDRVLWGECGLPVSEDNISRTRPLRWSFAGDIHGDNALLAWREAHAWLFRCNTVWGGPVRVSHSHPADVDWKAVEQALSAAARGQEHREAAVHEFTK